MRFSGAGNGLFCDDCPDAFYGGVCAQVALCVAGRVVFGVVAEV